MFVLSTGEIIKIFRKERGFSQEELGALIGVRRSAIQKYENQSIQNIKMDVLRRLCTHLRIPPLVLLFPENAKYFRKRADILDADIVETCMKLNDEGRKKVKEYILDLSSIEKYRFIEEAEIEQKEAIKENKKTHKSATN